MAWVGSWAGGRIWKEKDGSRTYHINRMVKGVRYAVSTRTTSLEAARVHLKRFESDPAGYSPGPTQDDVLRLTEALIDSYVAYGEQQGHVKETLRRHRRYLQVWRDLFGQRDLRSIKSFEVSNALDFMPSRTARLMTLRGLYTWLKDEKRYEVENPCVDVKYERSRPAQLRKPKVIEEADFLKVVEHLTPRWLCRMMVLYRTGWHLSELLRFAEDGRIEPLPAGRKDGSTHVLICPRHKMGGIHKTAANAETTYWAEQVQKFGAFDRGAMWKAIRAACIDAGMKEPWNPSWVRHTLATRAVNAGASVESVADFLGHRDRATTMKFYATHGVVQKPEGV